MRLPGKVAAAFRLAAQCPSQLHHRVPDLSINVKEPPPPPKKKKITSFNIPILSLRGKFHVHRTYVTIRNIIFGLTYVKSWLSQVEKPLRLITTNNLTVQSSKTDDQLQASSWRWNVWHTLVWFCYWLIVKRPELIMYHFYHARYEIVTNSIEYVQHFCKRTKCKVVPVHRIKAYWGRTSTHPLTLNRCSKRRWVVNITPRPLPARKSRGKKLNTRLGGPHSRSEKKNCRR